MKNKVLVSVALLLANPIVDPQSADGKPKFLGNIIGTSGIDENFGTYWNQVTPENSGKWEAVEPTRGSMDWSTLDAVYRFAQRHHFPFKEHNFIWGAQQPKWINGIPPNQQRLEVKNWIREYGQRYPHTQFIDVVNEPLHSPPPYKNALGGDGSTGWDWVIWAYATARKYCPRSRLLLNEYHTLEGGSDLERFIAIVKLLKQRKLIDGIGVQGHELENASDTTIHSSLRRLASLGLPIYVSELDLNIADDEAQQKRYQSLFPIFWQDPAVAGVTLWGYKQNQTWKPETYLLRVDGSERPALVWLKNYVKHTRRG
jgi:endo-1,4-beta-xylanase